MCRPDLKLAETTFVKELKNLVDAGFTNKNQNLKLLLKTQGDVETVKNFLLAKNALKMKTRLIKDQVKLARMTSDKQEKKLEKAAKKEERKALKKEKKDALQLKKLEKATEKEERKPLKKEESNNNSAQVVSVYKLSESAWPAGPIHLYLDGNNMLFVVASIRSLVLKRKTKAAEASLEALARKFASSLDLEHCTLVFDDTKTAVSETGITVCSARPTFPTSDDALVEWTKENKDKPAMVVTSDRGLMDRLANVGNHVLLVKPKDWFYFVAKVLSGSDNVKNLDEWMSEWLKTNLGSDEIAQEVSNLRI